MHHVNGIEIAELAKIIENVDWYLQMAFANPNNINFPGLRAALNTKWNDNILDSRVGIQEYSTSKGQRWM
ncbi:MAG TPA: hypothetical protein VFI73_02480 [Candidatus Nitrosopolaris sp.]|nr:hypothetical protein [Candidatus Nitrosopolaris sp.]